MSETFATVAASAEYPSEVKTLLGEALAAVELMGATVKFNGKISLQLQGDGPVSLLLAQASTTSADSGVRGLAHWKGKPASASLSAILGKGRLMITMEPDGLKENQQAERYQGITALEGDTLAQTLEHYFSRSEQLPTRIWLHAQADQVAGFMLQQMPGDAPDRDGWNRVSMLADTLQPEELLALPVPALLHRLFHEDDIRLFDPRAVRFRCGCAKQKIERVLVSLGSAEVDSIIAEQGQVEARCDFCNKQYVFDPVDVAELFAPGIHVPGTDSRH